MTSFGHNTVGALIGISVFSYASGLSSATAVALVFTLGLLSHYLCDALPHGHYSGVNYKDLSKLRTKLVPSIDFLSSLLLILLFIIFSISDSRALLLASVGIFSAQLPDLLDLLIEFKIIKKGRLMKAHRYFHWNIIHWHNPPQDDSEYPIGRSWSYSDIWQVVPVLAFVFAVISA